MGKNKSGKKRSKKFSRLKKKWGTLNSDQYIKLIIAVVYLICLCFPFSTVVADSAHYYSLLIVYAGLGFVFSFILWPVSLLTKLRPHHVKGNIKTIIILIFVSFICISASLLILFSFWGTIFGDERSSPTDKIEAFIPFGFIAVDLIRLKFFSQNKRVFRYLLTNSAIAFIIYLIALPVSSVFSFNGLEYQQNNGLVAAVLYFLANVCFSDFLGLATNSDNA